jgi:hypothetical protein
MFPENRVQLVVVLAIVAIFVALACLFGKWIVVLTLLAAAGWLIYQNRGRLQDLYTRLKDRIGRR